MKFLFAFAVIGLVGVAQAQNVVPNAPSAPKAPSAPSGLSIKMAPAEIPKLVTCVVPKNSIGAPGEFTATIDLEKSTATRDGQTLKCEKVVITQEQIDESLDQAKAELDHAVSDLKKLTQAQEDRALAVLEAQLKSVKDATLLNCPDSANDEARNYFINTTDGSKSHYGYDGGTFSGIVSEMNCK